MRVHMDCPGCEAKIKKSLQKLDGVDDVDIDMAMQKVTVMGWADQRKVLKAVRKTGRRAELWPYPYNPEYHNYAQQYYSQQQQQVLRRQPPITYQFLAVPRAASSYNYYVHGYDGHDYGYYQQPPYSSLIDEQSSSMFSDDNPHACSIM
ncbi:hypothetical protein SLE2022_389100 [Rubroshorea leprosula]